MEFFKKITGALRHHAGADGDGIEALSTAQLRQRGGGGKAVDVGIPVAGNENQSVFFFHRFHSAAKWFLHSITSKEAIVNRTFDKTPIASRNGNSGKIRQNGEKTQKKFDFTPFSLYSK